MFCFLQEVPIGTRRSSKERNHHIISIESHCCGRTQLGSQPPGLNQLYGIHLLHEVLVRHHVELLGCRFGHGHQEDVDARLSGQRGRLLQVVGGPAVDQHDDHPGVAPPGAVLLAEEGPGSVRDGLAWQRGGATAQPDVSVAKTPVALN